MIFCKEESLLQWQKLVFQIYFLRVDIITYIIKFTCINILFAFISRFHHLTLMVLIAAVTAVVLIAIEVMTNIQKCGKEM